MKVKVLLSALILTAIVLTISNYQRVAKFSKEDKQVIGNCDHDKHEARVRKIRESGRSSSIERLVALTLDKEEGVIEIADCSGDLVDLNERGDTAFIGQSLEGILSGVLFIYDTAGIHVRNEVYDGGIFVNSDHTAAGFNLLKQNTTKNYEAIILE